jgi:hypothetical protein
MNHFSEKWFQEIAESARLPPISPEVINTLIPIVELQIRKIIQNAHKHQKRSKSRIFKGNDKRNITFLLVSYFFALQLLTLTWL